MKAYVESATLELKRQYTAEIKKEVVAFLNAGGGTIIIGIDDGGKVVGVDDPGDTIERFSQMVHEAIKPDPSLLCGASEEEAEGKRIVRIEIGKGLKKPYYIYEKGLKPSGVYLRINNTSQPASEEAIKQLIVEGSKQSYESSPCLRQKLSFSYAESLFGKAGISLKEKTLGLRDEEGHYTNLALLLSEECPFSIKVAVFESEDKSSFLDRKEFGGSLLRQADEAYAYLMLNNRNRGTYKGLLREDAFDYDPLVLREGLLNAIIHRDYSLSGSILISILSDRIEYVSIGGLVSGMTYEDMMLGVSRSRNENLANVFYRLKYVEAYGTGIEKIQGDYERTGLSPRFEVSDHGFLLVLPNKSLAQKGGKKPLSDEEALISYLREHGKASRSELQQALGLKLSKTRSLLMRLEGEGEIVRLGIGRATEYALKE